MVQAPWEEVVCRLCERRGLVCLRKKLTLTLSFARWKSLERHDDGGTTTEAAVPLAMRTVLRNWRALKTPKNILKEAESDILVPYAASVLRFQRETVTDRSPTYAYATQSFVSRVTASLKAQPPSRDQKWQNLGPKQRRIVERQVDGRGSLCPKKSDDLLRDGVEKNMTATKPSLPPLLIPSRLYLSDASQDLQRLKRDDARGVRLMLFDPATSANNRSRRRRHTTNISPRLPAETDAETFHPPRPMLMPWASS